jgi:hypothetical protein
MTAWENYEYLSWQQAVANLDDIAKVEGRVSSVELDRSSDPSRTSLLQAIHLPLPINTSRLT